MTPIQLLTELVTSGDDGGKRRFRCPECDAEFTSAKQPRRATCPQCLGTDPEPVGS